MDSFPSRCSVIVVGAGISGISAAKVLAESGVEELLILEASGRIGGRIKKERFGGVPVEIGAGWITGVGGREPNPVWELAGDSALRTCLSDYSNVYQNIYDRSGTIFPGRVASESYEKAVESAIQRLSNEEAIGTAAAAASGDPCDPQPLLTPKTPIELAIDFVLHDFEMAEVEPISTYTEMGEMEFLVADERGYEHLVFEMAQKFLRVSEGKIMDRRLQLNTVVREVKHSRNGVTVVTEDGQAFEADYAILSVSIGVLKSDLISFNPPLPRWKADAIDRCEVTIYTKIFLKFPYKFWPPGSGKEFFIYAHEQRGYYTFWQNLEKVYPGSNILVVTLTNDQSKRVEAQADEETLKEAMEVLRDMFGSEIPDASDILVPRWWNDRFQRGSYSNYPIVCDHRTASEMRAPVGRVSFTGEHTSVQFNGYVHGGYLSGVDSGKALVEEMKKEKESKSFVVGGLHKCDIPRHPFLCSNLGIPEAIL